MAQKKTGENMNLETKYLKLNTIEIAYTEYGTGPNLILIHGNSESKRIFKIIQMKYFSNFHSYALDSRGHGESISIENELSIKQISNDIIEFCKAMNINESFIIGYSDGGNVSLFLGKNDPNRFRKIVSISPNYLASGTQYSTLRLFKSISDVMIQLKSIGIDTTKWIKRFKLLLTDIGITKDELKIIESNMMFLYAENDLIKEDHILEIASLVPKSKCYKINKCNHLNIYKKEECINKIKEYFRE
jgi:pimeloyl-ACP methyl ester carboxylesterase